MRRSCVFGFLIISLSVMNSSSQDRSPQFRVRSLMTAQQFKDSGLNKLTETELSELDSWLSEFAITVLAASRRAGDDVNDFSTLEGAIIVADDGKFLGKITTNSIDSQSIVNSIGRYGSEINSSSILNQIGRYGGEISRMSPFNSITSTPPRIYKEGKFIAYLTTNSIKTPRIDPHALVGWLKSKR